MITFEKHAFKGLDTELSAVHNGVSEMAAMICQQLDLLDAALAQTVQDNSAAKAIDKHINAHEFEIESRIATILSKYTLVGDELRFVMTMLKIASTLERMGDMAKNCVKRVLKLSHPINSNFVNETHTLKIIISQMIIASIAFITSYDETKATAFLAQEDAADDTYKKIQLHLQAALGDNAQLLETTHMLFIIKNLERMADLTLEIVKHCYYIHHGSKFEKPNA